MKMTDFVHLHVHTYYSMLDGVASPRSLLERAKELDMKALAITDHGSMGAHLETQLEADQVGGVKPIFGSEMYLVDDHTFKGKEQRSANHIVLLAKNSEGYANLIKLNNIAWRDGFYYEPRIDFGLLEKYGSGLICLTACGKGLISGPALAGDMDSLRSRIKKLKKIFGKDFYLELQFIYIEEDTEDGPNNLQAELNYILYCIAKTYNISVAVTNDVHFLRKGDDILQTRLVKIQRETFDYAAPDNWLKTKTEILKAWKKYCPNVPEKFVLQGLENTGKIADQCNHRIPAEGKFNIPKFDIKNHLNYREYHKDNLELFFMDLLLDKLEEKGLDNSKKYIKRLQYEYEIIRKLGVIDYFLIVEDLFAYARSRSVLCHTRGSVNGSLVAWLLNFGVVDPIRHNILFERFLSPARLLTGRSDIDIDCDFEAEFRDEAIAYLKKKYGENRVCQVGSYNRMQLRAGIKDMGRIENEASGNPEFAFQALNKVTRQMQTSSLERELNNNVFKEWYDRNKDWLETYVLPIVGNPRAFAGHPAGVVITPSDIDAWLPIRTQTDKRAKGSDKRIAATAWENSHTGREDLFARGIMCLDCLGVKTLSVISSCIRTINSSHKKSISFKEIPIDDSRTMEAFSKGETIGVFQLSAPHITKIIKEMRPDCFDDIIALGALDRPGPLQANAHIHYTNRKHGEEPEDYIHESLKKVLADTHGVPIYSEHMMLMATEFGGLDIADAERMRQVVKAKDPKIFLSFKKKFLKAAEDRWGKDIKPTAERIWDAIRAFGTYAFPKAHSTAYAYYGNATQYLKVHYPLEFFSALLNYETFDDYAYAKRIAEYEYSFKFLMPDINQSSLKFTPDYTQNAIRWSLGAIKGVGDRGGFEIIDKQPFTSFDDFFERINKRVINKRVMEALIVVGCFDSFSSREEVMKRLYKLRKETWDGRIKWAKLTDADWNIEASELLGFDVIDIRSYFSDEIAKYKIFSHDDFVQAGEGSLVTLAGRIIRTHTHAFTKNGKQAKMMFIDFEVDGFEIPVVCWPDVLAELKTIGLPKKGQFAIIGGAKGFRNNRSQLVMDAGEYVYESLH